MGLPKVRLAGFTIADVSADELIGELTQRIASAQKTALFFFNSHMATTCDVIRDEIGVRPDVLIAADGIAADIACLFRNGKTFKENNAGTDFIPALLARLPAGSRVFLFGSSEDVVRRASGKVTAELGCTVVGMQDGFTFRGQERRLREAINAARPDVVLVALGNPAQEKWILKNMDSVSAPLLIAVGALFDFLADEVPRAPSWMRQARLEWLFRLCLEPRRLFHRYSVEIFKFLYLCYARR